MRRVLTNYRDFNSVHYRYECVSVLTSAVSFVGIYKVAKREKNYFGTLLEKLMDATEKHMKNSNCKSGNMWLSFQLINAIFLL